MHADCEGPCKTIDLEHNETTMELEFDTEREPDCDIPDIMALKVIDIQLRSCCNMYSI